MIKLRLNIFNVLLQSDNISRTVSRIVDGGEVHRVLSPSKTGDD